MYNTKVPLKPSDKWKFLRDASGEIAPYPYVAVSGIAYDLDGNFPLLYRSDKVRSAKNCWSLPSGLHELGLTIESQFCNELSEELNLDPIWETARRVHTYENISVADNYHWVINMNVVRVETLETLVNKEPDKHSEIAIVHYRDLLDDEGPLINRDWSPGLQLALKESAWRIVKTIDADLDRLRAAVVQAAKEEILSKA